MIISNSSVIFVWQSREFVDAKKSRTRVERRLDMLNVEVDSAGALVTGRPCEASAWAAHLHAVPLDSNLGTS
jgi:hypothetical protein